MKILTTRVIALALVIVGILLAPIDSKGAQDMAALKARIEAQERQLAKMREAMQAQEKELAELRTLLEQQGQQQTKSKEDVQALKEEVKVTRTQQAEWKSYDSAVHLAGYGAVNYDFNDGAFNVVTFNPIFHYQYKDLLLFEGEVEFELEDGNTEVALEYSTLDLLLHDYATLRAGKFLSPIGVFNRALHPAWINKMPTRPPGFSLGVAKAQTEGQAAPRAEVGVELTGGFPTPLAPSMYINYSFYGGNGPKLEVVEEDGELQIEKVDTEGFVGDEDGNKLFGGRLGFLPIPGLELGVSGAFSEVAVTEVSGAEIKGDPDRDYSVLGFDAAYQWRNLDLRGEYVRQKVEEAATSVAPEGQRWTAWYAQAAYKLLPTNLEAVFRYTDFDSTHADQSQEQWALGLNYLFAPNVIAKLAYEFNDGLTGELTDEDRLLLQLTFGF